MPLIKTLTDAAQADRDAFQRAHDIVGGCSCHISPPCSICIDPGNPLNQAENPDAWMMVEEDEAINSTE